METIERFQSTPPFDPITEPPHKTEQPARRWPYRLWRGSLAFLTVSTISFGLCSLVALRESCNAGWRNAIRDFRWAVLVTGDQIEVDEIGRFLKQIDGAGEVVFLPPEAIVDRLRRESLLQNQISALDPSRLPAIWQVDWSESLNLETIDDTLADLKRVPGVMDVAFEQRELDKVRYFRRQWFKTRLALSVLCVLGALMAVVFLGRFLFFTELFLLRPSVVVKLLLLPVAGWVVGMVLAHQTIGTFSWNWAWGGLVAGAVRVIGFHVRRFE